MPKLGCIVSVIVVLVAVVVGGLFLGVSKPGIHLPPGDLLKAEHPHHYHKDASDWEKGPVVLEVEVAPDDEDIEPGHEFHYAVKVGEADNLPDHPYYEWAFLLDGEEVHHESGVSAVTYAFAEKGDYGIEVILRDGSEEGQIVAGAGYHEGEKSAFPITNTMIASWISVVFLITIAYVATRKRQLVPRGLQNVVEAIVEWLLTFVENAAGRENGRRFFPVVATIFFFVITNAYLALFPIYNVIGWGHSTTYSTPFFGDQEGFVVTTTLLRSANTDVNLPLALAILSFCAVEFWGIRSVGFFAYAGKFIKIKPVFKSLASGKPMNMVTSVIEAFVGGIELLTEFIRLVSFTFRLFGNMTAGEVLLMMMAFLLPLVAAVPFYGLELLVGFIQALVFAGLTLGFAMIAVTPHEHEEEEGHGHGGGHH
ncbi:MAG: F0F1 ATP synthase subunit A [Chloroflexi bacterium]|nr:F0F1 ATP synthase subunit A [Chloroflexota bacterium]